MFIEQGGKLQHGGQLMAALIIIIIIIIIIIASHEDEMNDQYNDELCTSNEVFQ